MATIRLAPDFKEFLQSLRSAKIEYLLVGGYAVGHYGHPRATGSLDLWVAVDERNATALVKTVRAFGFDVPELTVELYARRETVEVDGVAVDIISLPDLKTNKRASGRLKHLDDVQKLP